MNITVIGRGRVGGGLAEPWERAGHTVTRLGRGGGDASNADAVLVAVPSDQIAAALAKMSGLEGKVAIDATNAFDGRDDAYQSLAHEVKALVGGPVAKAFNLQNAALYDHIDEQPVRPSNIYVAEAGAREVADTLSRDAGYEPVFAGGLEQARVLEDAVELFGAIRRAGGGPYFHRFAKPGETPTLRDHRSDTPIQDPTQGGPMSTKQMSNDAATQAPRAAAAPMRLEAVVVPVTDVDRASSFYQRLGWRVDADVSAGDDYRLVHLTPPASNASILFGKGVTSAPPGSLDSLVLAVDDIAAARDELLAHGVDVSELFHDAGGGPAGGFIADTEARAAGPDPQARSYATYATFSDPDGNRWLLQEITERAPGRV
jgi:predicted dinucleotide-binding enzyme/catechol 2,3-dioxygenase-like lactoylglutathione lyase family enzyme